MAGKRDRKKNESARRSRALLAQRRNRPSTTKQLLEDTAKQAQATAGKVLSCPDGRIATAAVAGSVRELALKVIKTSPQHGRYECKAGCAFCCHTAITVAAPEALAIADHIRENLDESQRLRLDERLQTNAKLAAGMSRAQYIAQRIPCAMLTEEFTCSVHPVRPLACAGFLSTSVAKCEAAYRGEPGADPSPGDKYAMAVGLGASYGLKYACRDAKLDSDFYELHHALIRALDNSDAATRWAAGQHAFDGCPT